MRLDAGAPGGHRGEDHARRASSGIQPPSRIFIRLAPKNARSMSRNTPQTEHGGDQRPAPDVAHGVEQQRGGQQHGGGDGRAIGARERGRNCRS